MIIDKYYTHSLYHRIPERNIGNFRIKKSTIPKKTFIRTYHPMGVFYHDYLSKDFPFVKLVEGDEVLWMSDTPQEQDGLRFPTILARGDVLILGLGLGLLPLMIKTQNKSVRTITIVEKYQEVADLVYPYIKYGKLNLEVCDAEDFISQSDRKFDFIYIDVWPDIITPIKEIDEWTEKVKPLLKEEGEVRCWLQELYNRVKLKIPKTPVQQTGPPAVREPCLICGKKLRYDYAGLCCDCADALGVSEMFIKEETDE